MHAAEPTLQGCSVEGRSLVQVAIDPGGWKLVVMVCGFFLVVIDRVHDADDVLWSAC